MATPGTAELAPPLPSPAYPHQPGLSAGLEIRDVTVLFGKFWALRGVNLNLPRGAILGLIGPNGAGKTTLLKVLAGLQTPTTGSACFAGLPLTDGDPRPDVCFVPDVAPMFEKLTPKQFLMLVGRLHGLGPAELEDKIAFWLDKLWLGQKAGQKIGSLSRGMKQRVGIGAALIADPRLLLLDEPASGLDPAGRVQFRQLLTQLSEMGKTLIVSSHILSDLSEYCTHVAMMSAGRIARFDGMAAMESATVSTIRYRMGLVPEDAAGTSTATARATSIAYSGGMGAAIQLVRHHTRSLATAEVELIDSTTLGLTCTATPREMAVILAELIGAGLPVWHLAPVGTDLEKIYLSVQSQQVD